MQYIPIRLGYNPYSNSEVIYKMRPFGHGEIVAKSRTGKSILFKNMALQAQNFRPQIMFDWDGDFKRTIAQPNWQSTNPMIAEDVYFAENFSFKISDFEKDDGSSFASLGFSDGATVAILKLLGEGRRFDDDPEMLGQMINDLPTDIIKEQKFRKKYGFETLQINSKIKESLVLRFSNVKKYFKSETDSLKYIDWPIILRKHKFIIINAPLSENLRRFILGKVLMYIQEYVKERKQPCLWIDEIDKIAPPLFSETLHFPSSLALLRDLISKDQRYGCVVWGATQSTANLHPKIREHIHYKIIGPMDYGDDAGLARNLKWDLDKGPHGYREFYFKDITNKLQKFVPEESMCLIR